MTTGSLLVMWKQKQARTPFLFDLSNNKPAVIAKIKEYHLQLTYAK
jgi:hypothetical protein